MSKFAEYEKIAFLPSIRCSCGSILSRPDIIEEYILRARQPAQNIAEERDEKIEKLRERKDLTTRQKIDELQNIQDEGKILMQRELRRVFNSLEIRRICCRVQIADYARQGLRNETVKDPETGEKISVVMTFDPESYYEVD